MSDTPPAAPRPRRTKLTLPPAPRTNQDLLDRLANLTDGVNGLRRAVDEERAVRADEIEALRFKHHTARAADKRSKRTQMLFILVVFVGVLVNTWVVGGVVHERNDRQRKDERGAVAACENANATRTELIGYSDGYTDRRIDKLLDLLVAVSPAPTPDEAARRETVKNQVKAELAANPEPVPTLLLPRDCSPHAVTTPTTLQPRS